MSIQCQSDANLDEETSFFILELMLGKTMEANTDFPETNLQKNLFLSLGYYNFNQNKEWAARLNYPKTGLSLGYTDFGNSEKVGQAISLLPFIEFSILKKRIPNLNVHVGFGVSYTNTQFNEIDNPFNRAITTDFNWSFKSFLYYDLYKKNKITYRFGLGYLHHSNGHTRLPNQGLNSLLASISAKFDSNKKQVHNNEMHNFKSKSQNYLTWRVGLGQNVLSEEFNTKKEVYSFAMNAGKIINNTFKFGGGFYYRFYEHYYDYINNDGSLIEEQLPHFKDNPFGYATNFGLFATSELLLGHVGFEFDIGLNIYKPFYKIDWQLNQGYTFENNNGETFVVLGELDWYYEIKRTVSSRMGLKYYLWSTNKAPKHNLFVGAHINANLGQADFTELSIGYTYRFNYKESTE
ncbi:acyloxyacyl hydrolase [Winogradskyella sp. A2]|uniref:acyloxyacyl hydrolase n=1 Tax=Winogradskyella sp. A2 TaxID=3366944 RepID=UPI00398C5809